MVLTITKSNKRCKAIVYLYALAIATPTHHFCTNLRRAEELDFTIILLSS